MALRLLHLLLIISNAAVGDFSLGHSRSSTGGGVAVLQSNDVLQHLCWSRWVDLFMAQPFGATVDVRLATMTCQDVSYSLQPPMVTHHQLSGCVSTASDGFGTECLQTQKLVVANSTDGIQGIRINDTRATPLASTSELLTCATTQTAGNA